MWNRSVEQRPERSRNLKTLLSNFPAKKLKKLRAQIGNYLVANHKQRTEQN
jgi:hypothetical protein